MRLKFHHQKCFYPPHTENTLRYGLTKRSPLEFLVTQVFFPNQQQHDKIVMTHPTT
jgi:hypothetical protein